MTSGSSKPNSCWRYNWIIESYTDVTRSWELETEYKDHSLNIAAVVRYKMVEKFQA